MKLTEAIARLLEAGWTESAIAAAVGISQPTVNRIKHGAKSSFDVGLALIALAKKARPGKRKRAA